MKEGVRPTTLPLPSQHEYERLMNSPEELRRLAKRTHDCITVFQNKYFDDITIQNAIDLLADLEGLAMTLYHQSQAGGTADHPEPD